MNYIIIIYITCIIKIYYSYITHLILALLLLTFVNCLKMTSSFVFWQSAVSKRLPDAVKDTLQIDAVRFLYVYLYISSAPCWIICCFNYCGCSDNEQRALIHNPQLLSHVVLAGLKSSFFRFISYRVLLVRGNRQRPTDCHQRPPSLSAHLKRQRSGLEVSCDDGAVPRREIHQRKPPGVSPTHRQLFVPGVVPGSKGSGEQKQPQKVQSD